MKQCVQVMLHSVPATWNQRVSSASIGTSGVEDMDGVSADRKVDRIARRDARVRGQLNDERAAARVASFDAPAVAEERRVRDGDGDAAAADEALGTDEDVLLAERKKVRIAEEGRDEAVGRPAVDLRRRPDLFDSAAAQDDDPVGD